MHFDVLSIAIARREEYQKKIRELDLFLQIADELISTSSEHQTEVLTRDTEELAINTQASIDYSQPASLDPTTATSQVPVEGAEIVAPTADSKRQNAKAVLQAMMQSNAELLDQMRSNFWGSESGTPNYAVPAE